MHNQERKKKGDCSPTSLVGLGETLQRRARAASLLSLNFLIVGVRVVQGGGVGGVGGEGRESRQSETGEIDKEGTVGRRDPEGAVRTKGEGEGKEENINLGKGVWRGQDCVNKTHTIKCAKTV